MNKIPNGKILVNRNHRYNLQHNRGTQSLDAATYSVSPASSVAGGSSLSNGNAPGSNGLRTVSSHPVFLNDSSNEVICNCHKCQVCLQTSKIKQLAQCFGNIKACRVFERTNNFRLSVITIEWLNAYYIEQTKRNRCCVKLYCFTVVYTHEHYFSF